MGVIYREIEYFNPNQALLNFYDQPWSLFFDSSSCEISQHNSRFSYIVIQPVQKITCQNGIINDNGNLLQTQQPLDYLNKVLRQYSVVETADIAPPFQGGMAGYFAYDLCHYLDHIPYPQYDDVSFYDFAIGVYDQVIAFDHQQKKAWIIMTVIHPASKVDYQKRIDELSKLLKRRESSYSDSGICISPDTIKSNFSKKNYLLAVNTIKDYITAGDLFEANLTQRFTCHKPKQLHPYEIYNRQRIINPAPFSAYMNFGDVYILSASPERFVQVQDGIVETRPIKGTIKRSSDLIKDKRLAEQLIASEKDRAENIMIVDLMRNDLTKICQTNSISVPKLCGLETFATVHHLVSVVCGKLLDDINAIDVMKAIFPGGSITGGPKIRAMQIISEIEKIRRGPYCGCGALIGFNKNIETSILIRTINVSNDTISFNAGGAVVLDSDPESEYQESLDKAFAMHQSLTSASNEVFIN